MKLDLTGGDVLQAEIHSSDRYQLTFVVLKSRINLLDESRTKGGAKVSHLPPVGILVICGAEWCSVGGSKQRSRNSAPRQHVAGSERF